MKIMVYIISLFLIQACGYHFQNLRKSLPDGSTSIYIEPFQNETTTPQVEKFFTDAIKKQFYARKHVSVLPKSKAQAVLKGKVDKISLDATAFKKSLNENLEANVYLLTITISLYIENKSTGAIMYKRSFQDQEVFNVYERVMKSESERLKAANRIAKNMMRKAYDSILESKAL